MATEGPLVAQGPAKGTIVVCRGSDCRGSARDKLCATLADAGIAVESVGCLGICSGPAVAITIGDRLEFVSRVRGTIRSDIVAVSAGDGRPSRRLRKRFVRGSARRKATVRLTKRRKRISV